MLLSKLLLISLGVGPLISWGQQSCAFICTKTACIAQDIHNPKIYAKCVSGCEAACKKCVATVDTIFPKFYALGLLYAPPGCTSTAALNCSTPSTADYGSGSTMGTKTSISKSFTTAVDFTVSASFFGKDSKATTFGGSASTGYSNTSTDSSSATISKSNTFDTKVTGSADGVDHDQDQFVLLLNPALAVQRLPTFSQSGDCTPPSSLNWYFGINPATGNGPTPYIVSVGALKNPQSNPVVIQQLKALNFTDADFSTLLSLDPFANGSTTIDASRYSPTVQNFPYEPPDSTTECNKGVCTCTTSTLTLKNDLQTDTGKSAKVDYSVSLAESISGTLDDILKLGASSDQKFTWSTTTTTDDTTDSSQTATATIQCPSPGYTGGTEMLVYWDNLFGSFLFVPTQLGSAQMSTLAQGSVVSTTGKTVRHQPVTLSIDGKTYSTLTNNSGNYVFWTPPGLALAGTGAVTVMGVTQSVAASASQQNKITVP